MDAAKPAAATSIRIPAIDPDQRVAGRNDNKIAKKTRLVSMDRINVALCSTQ